MEQKQRLKYGVNTIIIVALLLTLIGWNGSTSIVHAEESSITAAIDDKNYHLTRHRIRSKEQP